MESIISINIKKLPTGYYQATTDNSHGIVAKGKTISEALTAAKNALRKILEV